MQIQYLDGKQPKKITSIFKKTNTLQTIQYMHIFLNDFFLFAVI